MRAVLGLTVLAAAAIALAWWVAGLPGTVSATIGDTTLSTSSPVALVLLDQWRLAWVMFAAVAAAMTIVIARAVPGGGPSAERVAGDARRDFPPGTATGVISWCRPHWGSSGGRLGFGATGG